MSQYVISYSPHAKDPVDVQKIMWGVVIAMFPAFLFSVYFYGIRAITVTAVSVIACVVFEYGIVKWILKKAPSVNDGSAVITGVLLAFNLPSSIPIWQIIIGALVAIGIAKITFGGIGSNPFNPALVARCFMIVSFPADMTTWPVPLKTAWIWNVDAITAATPLNIVKEGVKAGETVNSLMGQLPSYLDMAIGYMGGCIGEVSAVAILLGGIYMLFKKIITWHIPIFYLTSLFVFSGIFWLVDPAKYADPVFHIITGGAMLGAWFMATDMVTSPMSKKGQIIYAIGGGVICGAIRLFGAYPEGCSFSILIMNGLVPLIDKYVKPSRFGKEINFG